MTLNADVGITPPSGRQRRGLVAGLLDQSQARGMWVVVVADLARSAGLTDLAARRQLERLTPRVVRLPGRPAMRLLVSPEHRVRGAPPVANWLDAYFKLRSQPYYVGLLSAAALHGASQQALQITQVLTTKPMRPLEIGRLHIDFHVNTRLPSTPLAQLAGMPAPLAVSTAEATAIDLITFSHCIGGIRRASQVIADMKPAMTVSGLKRALAAQSPTAAKQRLGYVLTVLGLDRMAAEVQKSLPPRLAVAVLQTQTRSTPAAHGVHQPWRVLDNIGLEREWA